MENPTEEELNKVAQYMRNIALTYEESAIRFREDNKLHEMHTTMSNAKTLRGAASLIDGTCYNGG